MMVWPFLIIWTVIAPAARGILSLETPAPTENVDEEPPHLRMTVAGAVEYTAAHMESYHEASKR